MKQHIAEIVAAYVRKNRLDPTELPGLIASVNQAMVELDQEPQEPLTPAIPIRRSVQTSSITCLDCGWSGQMLKRHLSVAHNLSPVDYRIRWGLQIDYPMTTPSYSARRSVFAKSVGLGKPKGRR